MGKYRKKPVVIDAEQWLGTADSLANIVSFTNGTAKLSLETAKLTIPTLEGDHIADVKDWIIKGIKGEFYPCKPDIFDNSYEKVVD